MQPHARSKPDSIADEREQYVFAENIGRNLVVVKSEHLYGGNFADSLRDIDICKVVKHHKRQHRSGNNYENNHIIEVLYRVAE